MCGLLLWPAGNGLAQPVTQFNVKNYGAAGDSVRLDTDAINKTIQAAPPGRRLDRFCSRRHSRRTVKVF